MSILEKNLIFELDNGEKWALPVKAISEYTLIEFDGDLNEIIEVAKTMEWINVKFYAEFLESNERYNHQEGWANAEFLGLE